MTRLAARLFAALACLAATPGAHAGPQDMRDLGALASGLFTQARELEDAAGRAALEDAAPVDPAFVRGLQRFGLAATEALHDLSDAGGPADLQCIFRGMAEETDVQLAALADADDGAEQSQAFDRLAAMLEDAAAVTEAAARALEDIDPGAPPVIGSCAAEPLPR